MRSFNVLKLHKIAAIIALLTVVTFWSSTVISELFFSLSWVAIVKRSILFYGLPILIISMMTTGISGNLIGKNHPSPQINIKKKRMPIIALNGVLIMIPLVIYLYIKSKNSEFDGAFYSFQILELGIGMIQILLMSLQINLAKKASFS